MSKNYIITLVLLIFAPSIIIAYETKDYSKEESLLYPSLKGDDKQFEDYLQSLSEKISQKNSQIQSFEKDTSDVKIKDQIEFQFIDQSQRTNEVQKSTEEDQKIFYEKILTRRQLPHKDCGKAPAGDLIPNLLAISRYYEWNTGTKNLISNSYLDFYTGVPNCNITLYQSKAEQGTSQSLATTNGITSISCYAVISTMSTNIPTLTTFRIGCQTIYYEKGYNKPGTPNQSPTASSGFVYSNTFKIAIIKFCGSNSYIDQLQISYTFGLSSQLIMQDQNTDVDIDISKLFKFSDPNCATSKITLCELTFFGITGVKITGTTWRFRINSNTYGTKTSTIECSSSESTSKIISVSQNFIISPQIACSISFSNLANQTLVTSANSQTLEISYSSTCTISSVLFKTANGQVSPTNPSPSPSQLSFLVDTTNFAEETLFYIQYTLTVNGNIYNDLVSSNYYFIGCRSLIFNNIQTYHQLLSKPNEITTIYNSYSDYIVTNCIINSIEYTTNTDNIFQTSYLSPNGAVKIFMPLSSGIYKYQLKVCSSSGSCFTSSIFYINIECLNLTLKTINSLTFTVSKNNPTQISLASDYTQYLAVPTEDSCYIQTLSLVYYDNSFTMDPYDYITNLTIAANLGQITFTFPSNTGTFTFQTKVCFNNGCIQSDKTTIVITCPTPVITTIFEQKYVLTQALPDYILISQSTNYSAYSPETIINGIDLCPIKNYSLLNYLNKPVSIQATSGTLTIIPKSVDKYTFAVQACNNDQCIKSTNLTIEIACGLPNITTLQDQTIYLNPGNPDTIVLATSGKKYTSCFDQQNCLIKYLKANEKDEFFNVDQTSGLLTFIQQNQTGIWEIKVMVCIQIDSFICSSFSILSVIQDCGKPIITELPGKGIQVKLKQLVQQTFLNATEYVTILDPKNCPIKYSVTKSNTNVKVQENGTLAFNFDGDQMNLGSSNYTLNCCSSNFCQQIQGQVNIYNTNTPPKFVQALNSISLKVANLDENTNKIPNDYPDFSYTFPQIVDNEFDNFSLKIISKLPQFMKFDNIKNTIIIKLSGQSPSIFKKYVLQAYLEDSQGANQTLTFFIQIQLSDKKQAEVIIVEQNNSSLTKNGISARISDITFFGVLTVTFNSSVDFKNVNFTWFNMSSVDIYIQPALENYLNDEFFNLSSLNLTWVPLKLVGGSFTLQLNFFNTTAISQRLKQDKIVIHLKNEDSRKLFYSTNSQEFLCEESYTMNSSMKKQMTLTPATSALAGGSNMMNTVIQGTTVFGAGLNLFIYAKRPTKLFTLLVRSLQLIIMLPIFGIVLPANVIFTFKIIKPCFMFDVLEKIFSWDEVPWPTFDKQAQESIKETINEQTQDLGFESHNAVINLSTVGLLCYFYLVEIMLLLVLQLIYKCSCLKTTAFLRKFRKFVRGLRNSFKKTLFFSQVLMLGIEGFLELLFSTYLSIQAGIMSTDGEIIGAILSYLCISIALVFLPSVLFTISRKTKEQLQDKKFEQKYGLTYEDFQLQSLWTRLYYIPFMIRRIVYIATSFNLSFCPSLQVITLLGMNTLQTIYLGFFNPNIDKFEDRIEIFNEVMTHIVMIHLIFFTDWIQSIELQYNLGWSMIAHILLIIAVNIFFIGIATFHEIKLLITKYYRILMIRYLYCQKKKKQRQAQEDLNSAFDNPLQNFKIEQNVQENVNLDLNQSLKINKSQNIEDQRQKHLNKYKKHEKIKVKIKVYPMPKNSPRFGGQNEEDENVNNINKIRITRWLYRKEQSGRQYQMLIELPAKQLKGHFTYDDDGNLIMLRDIDADYAHEIQYDENLNLLSPDIKILKKEYLDEIQKNNKDEQPKLGQFSFFNVLEQPQFQFSNTFGTTLKQVFEQKLSEKVIKQQQKQQKRFDLIDRNETQEKYDFQKANGKKDGESKYYKAQLNKYLAQKYENQKQNGNLQRENGKIILKVTEQEKQMLRRQAEEAEKADDEELQRQLGYQFSFR